MVDSATRQFIEQLNGVVTRLLHSSPYRCDLRASLNADLAAIFGLLLIPSIYHINDFDIKKLRRQSLFFTIKTAFGSKLIWKMFNPMFGNLLAGTAPYLIVALHILNKALQCGHTCWAPYNTTV